MTNYNLINAQKAKNDEFYTQYIDIEKEMNAYLEHDKATFKDATILLPCDDPEWSNFTKYFAQNFKKLGLKKLISTSYAPNRVDSPNFDEVKTRANGKIFTLTKDIAEGGAVDFNDFEWDYLEGDGDFRSEEVTALLEEATHVITNPPFSLFREFIAWIMSKNKKFTVIGNMNAITYKEVFPLIKDNKMWLGVNNGPKSYIKPDKTLQTLGNTCWFTNIEHGRRHEPLQLMTQKDNLKFNKKIKEVGYQKYDNYDAIEVPRVEAIPSDYKGVMGVPITFLGKYNPDQFEIVKFRHGNDDKDLRLADGKTPYFRILIQHKKAKKDN